MADKDNKFDIQMHFAPGETEKILVIRHDEPKKVYEPSAVSLKGTIKTPSEFVTKRGDLVDPKVSHVTFDKDKLSITLVVKESEVHRTTVVGQLERNPFLNRLRINSDSPWTIPALRKELKFAKIHFKDKTAHKQIIFGLNNYISRVEKTIEEFNNRETKTKGSSVKKQLVEVSEGVNFDFTLFTPLFVGGPKVEIPLRIEKEPGDGQVELFIEYDEWEELQEKEINEVFSEQMDFFKQFAIVEKS